MKPQLYPLPRSTAMSLTKHIYNIHLLHLSPPEANLKKICRFYDVVEHLNLSANRNLLLYTTPKKNWEEPLELNLDFTLLSILSVVRIFLKFVLQDGMNTDLQERVKKGQGVGG